MVDGGNGVHALLQFPHQLHAYRFKLLFESNNTNIFPEGFAREAIEIGPAEGQNGPCLLLFTFVSLSPQQFTEWQDRTCYDWAILRLFWLPAVAVPGAATAAPGTVRPYATFTGLQALREALRATPIAPGPGGNRSVRLQVFPRTEEAAMADLLADVVSLDLDNPQYVLGVVQWPSEAVAAAAAALTACEADHLRLAKAHEKQQKASLRMAEELEETARKLREAGAVALTEAEMAAEETAAAAGTGMGAAAAAAAGAGDCGLGAVGGNGAGGGDLAGAEKPVPVLDAVAAVTDPTERWRAAVTRAALERRRVAEREVRRAGVVARCAEERAAREAELAAAQAVSEYSFGLVPAEGFYRYSSERGKKLPGQLCRAAGKLREALIACTGSAALPPGLAAVDVGAAPGGWSQQLAAAGARLVVAIDPAEMDPAIAALPNLVHLQCKCEQAVASGRLASALQEAGLQHVDYVVCDVNAHPGDAFAMLEPVLPLLARGGKLIVTLKTFGRGRDKESHGAELEAKLGAGFEPGRLVWLLSNTLCERTYVTTKR